jgi:4'-phosphopantetheinyl transferase
MPISQHSIQVWIVRVAGQAMERWRPILTSGEWERTMRFRMPADQARFAVTRGVLRTLLGRYLQLPGTAIVFSANEYGKPAAEGGIKFNVAHSGDYGLLAFTRGGEVGVDVERMSGDRVVSDLARRVLSATEYERFEAVAENARTTTFFQIWTLKEAVLKALGSGLSIAPECLEMAFYPDEPRLLGCSANEIGDVNEWTVRSISIGDGGYAAALAVRMKMPVIEVKRFRESDWPAVVP